MKKVTIENGLPNITIKISKQTMKNLPKGSYENARLFGLLRQFGQINTNDKEKALDYMNELDILGIPYKAQYK